MKSHTKPYVKVSDWSWLQISVSVIHTKNITWSVRFNWPDEIDEYRINVSPEQHGCLLLKNQQIESLMCLAILPNRRQYNIYISRKNRLNATVLYFSVCVCVFRYDTRYMILDISFMTLINWSRVTKICVSELTIVGSHSSLSPGQHFWYCYLESREQASVKIVSEIHPFSFKHAHGREPDGVTSC